MDVILHYATGFPTRLRRHKRLAELIARDGEPKIEGRRLVWSHAVGRFATTWDYMLSQTNWFPGDNRELVRVSIENPKF